jgi:cytochrome c556
MRSGRVLIGAALVFFGGLPLQQCTSRATTPEAAEATLDLKPYVSVKELMENIVDPQSDGIFDSVMVVSNDKGTVETKPRTDEDWAKVRAAAVTLAEVSNLLKIPREMAPPDDPTHKNPIDGPELPPKEIEKRVARDRSLWNKHADGLRDEALKVLDIVKARDADKLFEAGSELDKACEMCHLEYWYPGDKEAVLRDQKSKVYKEPVKK